MGHHPSRRDILRSIPVLGGGTILAPLAGQQRQPYPRAVIRGTLTEKGTGKPVATKLRITETNRNQIFVPENAVKTMPDRRHYFYAKGSYEVAVPAGRYRVEAVRGISHEVVAEFTEVGPGITHTVDLEIPPLKDMRAAGWYSGNTHTHYHVEIDENPDDRLRIVPPAEDLDVSVISYLIRTDSPYITNKYKIGRLPEFSRDGTLMDMGEEARNNRTFGEFGYGHCLFLNIPRAIEPVSTGLLANDPAAPDYPTLSTLCEEVRSLKGTVVWCHNGSGMESPVAAVFGLMNAYNIADGLDADYPRYYKLLNAGLEIPLSTGTDWWIYDHNRVFVQTQGPFTYDSWIAGLRAGRTFASNGPLVEMTVDGHGPGDKIRVETGRVHVMASALSRVPFERIEIVVNGEVLAEQPAVGQREVRLEREIEITEGGWIAARVMGGPKTYAGYMPFAHTSPVYVRVPGTSHRRAEAIGSLMDEIGRSMRTIGKTFKFRNDSERALAVGKFEQARRAYGKLLAAAE